MRVSPLLAAVVGLVAIVLGAFGGHAPARGAPEASEEVEDPRGVLERASGLREEGRYREADRLYAEVAGTARMLRDLRLEEIALDGRFRCLVSIYAYGDLAAVARRLLEVQEERHATTESDLGGVLVELGEYEPALAHLGRAAATFRTAKRWADLAHTLTTMAIACSARGRFAEALSTADEARRVADRAGDPSVLAYALGVTAALHSDLGEYERALPLLQRLRDLVPEDDRMGRADALRGIGVTLTRLQRFDEAEAIFEEAVGILRDLGDELGLARAFLGRGELAAERGDAPGAREYFAEALAHAEGFAREEGWALQGLGQALLDLEPPRTGEAQEVLRGALERGEALCDVALLMECRGSLAEARLQRDEPAGALAEAEAALAWLDLLDAGLADEEAAFARAHNGRIFDVALRSVLVEKRPKEVFRVLERSRATALAAMLGGSAALGDAGLDDEQRASERTARERVVATQKRFLDACAGGNREHRRKTGDAWTAARAAYRSVLESIERETKRTNVVRRVAPATLEEIQSDLSDTVLVVYALLEDTAGALVVTSSAARWVDLGRADEIRSACDDLATCCERTMSERARGAERLTDSDPESLAARLADLVLLPLDLPRDGKRLLVSPDGPLASTPFSFLLHGRKDLPAEADVALIPSATVYALLARATKRSGRRLLALGDPDYRGHEKGHAFRLYGGGRLDSLPASREEVEAITSESDVVLLGHEASETALRAVLEGAERWRAVHFACHGLMNSSAPALCALALTPTAEDDGFLTAIEIFRLDVPADLVVLSACETGRGRAVRGEGLLGVARAFIAAGSPRVIASLWRVDDDATRVLMKYFYDEWGRPHVTTATALGRAQARLRGKPGSRWYDPHHWAAWVLWGLPD